MQDIRGRTLAQPLALPAASVDAVGPLSSGLRAAKMLLAFAVAAAVCACASDGATPTATAPKEPGSIVSSTSRAVPVGVPAGSSAKLIRYTMEGVGGGLTEANTLLFTPAGPTPQGGWPLVVWAHGTTGVSDACAPSRLSNYPDTEVVSTFLSRGMAVVAPDYEGLDAPGVHPYFNRASHALSVLRAVQASIASEGGRLAQRWAVIGHSQGGHVALATAEMAGSIAGPGLLRSAVLLAPGSDLDFSSDQLFDQAQAAESAGNIERAGLLIYYLNLNGTFVLQGMKAAQPSIDSSSLVGARLAPLLPLALTDPDCSQLPQAILGDLMQWVRAGNSVTSYPGIQRNWHQSPAVGRYLTDNRIGNVQVRVPVDVVQGTDDEQVPATATERLVQRMRASGTTVNLTQIPGDHGAVVTPGVLATAADRLRARLVEQ